MRVLVVSRFKKEFPSHIVPFVEEQGEALRKIGCEVDFFQIKGSYLRRGDLLVKIREFRPDIIHAHYGLSGITAVLQSEVPVVTTFHNGEISSFGVNFLSSLFSLRASHVIYVAQHIYDKCLFKRKDRHCILPCGIEPDDCVITAKAEARRILGLSPDRKYILFGGAFSNLRKNYPLLRQALGLLGADDVECLEIKGLSRRDVSLRMCACDVFALPSKSEGSPQALKEAMACNCPVVATGIADIRQLLGDLPGHYICTFDPADVADKLGRALEFSSSGSGRTDGRERIVCLGLTNEMVAEKLMMIYESVLGKK